MVGAASLRKHKRLVWVMSLCHEDLRQWSEKYLKGSRHFTWFPATVYLAPPPLSRPLSSTTQLPTTLPKPWWPDCRPSRRVYCHRHAQKPHVFAYSSDCILMLDPITSSHSIISLLSVSKIRHASLPTDLHRFVHPAPHVRHADFSLPPPNPTATPISV